MIRREKDEERLNQLLKIFPVVSILGPRQVGKTTLAKKFISKINKESIYLDLELQSDLNKLTEAELYLTTHKDKCIIIDEIQIKPELYPLIRALTDQDRKNARFLILGSASPALVKGTSESLAGRIGQLELSGFNLDQVNRIENMEQLWLRGGFPDIFLSDSDEEAFIKTDNFITAYIQIDLPQLGLNISPQIIRRFWTMLAHFHSGIWNATGFGRALGVSNHTVNRYLDFMEGAFLINKLQPFYSNTKKRLIKSPKIYIRDSGILHRLNEINNFDELYGRILVGNSWEGFVIEQVRQLKGKNISIYFYRTHNGAEIDLVFAKSLQAVATAEIKYTNTPKTTKGFMESIKTLNTINNYIITPGSDSYMIAKNVRVCSLQDFLDTELDKINEL